MLDEETVSPTWCTALLVIVYYAYTCEEFPPSAKFRDSAELTVSESPTGPGRAQKELTDGVLDCGSRPFNLSLR